MGNGNDYPPSIPLCRLYERTSKKGTHYLTGRLGAAKVVILKSSGTTDDGAPIWNVLVSPAPQSQKPAARPAAEAKPREGQPEAGAARDWQRPPFDDVIPF